MILYTKICYHFIKIKHTPKKRSQKFFMELQIYSEQDHQHLCLF